MVKLKIYPTALQIRNEDFVRSDSNSLDIIKLTYEQAMSFSGTYSSFEDMLRAYGHQRLHVDEDYKGYIAIFHTAGRQDVVYMDGHLRLLNFHEVRITWRYNLDRERIYTCEYQCPDGKYIPGIFRYVWTFDGCAFSRELKSWQEELSNQRIFRADTMAVLNKKDENGVTLAEKIRKADPYETDKSLKRKLIDALLSPEKIVKLEDEENFILRAYAPDYYRHFFSEIED